LSGARIEITSASAGSGKTHYLAEFLADQVEAGSVRPDAILGTTFTRKAAKELQERVRGRLLQAGRFAEAHRLAASRIGTVNAVCSTLVGDFAFELGLSPGVEVLEEALADDEFERALADSMSVQDERRLSDLAVRLPALDWRAHIADLCGKARSNGRSAAQIRGDGARSRQGLLGLFGTPSPDPHEVQIRPLLDALARFTTELETEIAARDAAGANTAKKTRQALVHARTLRTRLHRQNTSWSAILGAINKIAPEVKLAHHAEPVHQAILRFLDTSSRLLDDVGAAIDLVYGAAANALGNYQRRKRERGVLDFSDQESLALELLQMPAVQEELAAQLDLVLVDEFQDTSPIQLAIFLELSKLAKRSVWVGDQKQAIYGFRGADPALMDAALIALGDDALSDPLNRSWRSRPQLVELTSALFGAAFPGQGIAAERVRLTPALVPEPAGLGPVVERWLLDSKNKREDAHALATGVVALLADEAAAVWDKETRQVRRPTPGDVAILCRLNATAQAVAEALEAQGIRAVLPRSGLLETAEGTVALAALRLVADPRDALSIAILSRFLDGTDAPDAWLSKLLQQKYAQNFAGLAPVAALEAAHREAPQAGALQAFDAAIEAVGLHALCARWGSVEARRANLERLRAHAEQYVTHCDALGSGCTPTGLVAYFDGLAGGADSQATVASADAVQVSTWHGAKGLEWPITVLFELPYVPLAKMAKSRALGVHVASDTQNISLDAPLAERWLRYWPNPFGDGQKGTRFHERLQAHSAELAAEEQVRRQELRLLYVAWTRARDRVVIAARPGQLTKGILTHLADENGPLISEPEDQATWAGVTVDVARRFPAPADPVVVAPVAGPNYTRRPITPRPPAWISPSKIEADGATPGEPESLGDRIPLQGAPEMSALGEAIHGFLAADPGAGHPDRAGICQQAIERWGVAAHIQAAPILAAADSLKAWVEVRWPGATWLREWPVLHRLDNGSIVRGFIDLVLETDSGFVVIDHKSFPGGRAQAIERAATYAGQLRAYGDGITAATGRPIRGSFIHLPVSGLVIEVFRD
jgi:ATP-dependent exoDNAse (exonuclease V) beta subunit